MRLGQAATLSPGTELFVHTTVSNSKIDPVGVPSLSSEMEGIEKWQGSPPSILA